VRHVAGLPRTWLGLAVVLALVGLFVLDGAAAGVVCFAALVAFVVYCFRAVAGHKVEDRTLGTGLFSGWF
jgi:hypothetical protein